MNRLLFLSLCATPVLAAVVACAGDDPGPVVPPGTAGAPTGVGGSIGTSGSTSGGDTSGGMAGTSPIGGSAGTTTPVGGSAGTAGDGAGGTPIGGSAGTAGGGAGGTMGGGGAGGAMGGTGGGSSEPITIEKLVGKLDGHFIMTPCADTPNTDDCNSGGWIYDGKRTPCSNGKLDSVVTYDIGGTMGKTYQVDMHFYGVMEPKTYGGSVMREAGNTPTNAGNTMPLPWGTQAMPGATYQRTAYNTYEVHVINPGGMTVGSYFINANTNEGHFTFAISYARTIPIIGGGKVRVRSYDDNCRQIKNCGASAGYPCAQKARTVDISKAMPQPMGLSQPGLGQAPDHSGQWFLLDVTAVREM